ncbi:MAG: LLM class flavin-dependent oxidoreductase [Anaerolineae bacterium]|nr:LLM class flavin-dependent oxidoreductase [Anaerolineae bacterium]
MRQVALGVQTDKTPAEYVALAQLIDQYDVDVVHVYCDLPYTPSYLPLAMMAPHLRRARLGPAGVSLARMTPVDIAADTAFVAQLARGGVSVGLVRGGWLGDYGVREPERPLQAIREGVAVIRYMLSGGTGGLAGDLFSLAEHAYSPWALPAGTHVPILIGSWGRRLCALAGEVADEVKIGGSTNPAMLPLVQKWIGRGERLAARRPRSVALAIGAVCVADEDRDLARAAARRSVAMYLPIVSRLDPTVEVEPELVDRLQSLFETRDEDGAAGLISDDLLDRFAFSGNAKDLIDQAERLYDAGATRVEFGTPQGIDSARGIRLIGEQVIPALQGN